MHIYEIHITVQISNEAEINLFKERCKLAKVKPLIIGLQTKAEGEIRDVMTSSVFKTEDDTLRSVKDEIDRISFILKNVGLNVVRHKIEIPPWHPLSPSASNGLKIKNGQYFESHFPILIDSYNQSKIPDLQKFCLIENIHLSRNKFHQREDEYCQMATLRKNESTSEEFIDLSNLMFSKIKKLGFNMEKPNPIIEFAVFDSNSSHDDIWVKS